MSSKYLKHLKAKKKQEEKKARLREALERNKKRELPFIRNLSQIKDEMLEKYAGVFLFYLEIDLLPVETITSLTGLSSSFAAELNTVFRKSPDYIIEDAIKIIPRCMVEAKLDRGDIPFDLRYAIEPAPKNPHHHVDFNIAFVVAADLKHDIKDIPLRENPNAEVLYSSLIIAYLNYYSLRPDNKEHVDVAVDRVRIPRIFNPTTNRLEELSSCTLIDEDKLPPGFVINRK